MKSLPRISLLFAVMLILQLLATRFWLGSDIVSRTFQVLLYGPFLLAGSLLHHARRAWGLPIELSMFGDFPDWLEWLLLFMNWVVCSLFYFGLGSVVTRARARVSRPG